MGGYIVLIVIDHPKVKAQWWSDQIKFRSLGDAQKHRREIAERWSDCDTAIRAPDGRILLFLESVIQRKHIAEARAAA